jgi:BASS family bile acid:Na+ symporter
MTLDELVNLLALIALVELMVTIGLGVSFGDVIGVARNWQLVGQAALASYVCVPAFAVALLLLFHAQPLVAVGFLVVAACPGAPFGPPLTGLARGNVVLSVGLMVILAASSALVAPVLLYLLLPLTSGGQEVEIDASKMIGTLLIAQLLPLCVGLALRQWRPALAARLKKPASLLSLVLNLLLLGTVVIVQFDMLIGIPLRGYVGMFVLVAASVAAGWLLGGPGRDNRTAMVMATSVRNVGVALVIVTGTESLAGTPAVTAATAFALFQTILMLLVALCWGRLLPPTTPEVEAQDASADSVTTGAMS